MHQIVYVKLLDDGVSAYRPVPASQVEGDIYSIGGQDIYDEDDENWEFQPGMQVRVESKLLEGELVLIAVTRP